MVGGRQRSKRKRQLKKASAAFMGSKTWRTDLRRLFPHLERHHERRRTQFRLNMAAGEIGRIYSVRVIEDKC